MKPPRTFFIVGAVGLGLLVFGCLGSAVTAAFAPTPTPTASATATATNTASPTLTPSVTASSTPAPTATLIPSATYPPRTATQAAKATAKYTAVIATASAKNCLPTDQDQYVYNPTRLVVLRPCIHVTGVVVAVRKEADGDLHILLNLDLPYVDLLTAANADELGALVVEPVCVRSVSQADAIAVCAADPDPLTSFPTVGQHIWMEGRYVTDSEHGGWAELHPLYRWGVESGSAAGPTVAAGPTRTPAPPVAVGPTWTPVPLAPTQPPTGGTSFDRNGDGKVTCADFSTQAEAKVALAAGYKALDRDGDGIPCESLPAG
jgi:hypothetical protein